MTLAQAEKLGEIIFWVLFTALMFYLWMRNRKKKKQQANSP